MNDKWVLLKIPFYSTIWGQHLQQTIKVKLKVILQIVIGNFLLNWNSLGYNPPNSVKQKLKFIKAKRTLLSQYTEGWKLELKIEYSTCNLPWKKVLVLRKATASLRMDNLSNFPTTFCSNGSREAKWSNSPFNRILWRFEGLLLAWLVSLFVGVGLKLQIEVRQFSIRLICGSMNFFSAFFSNYHIIF